MAQNVISLSVSSQVKFAHQVMKIAELFTNNDSGFRLYWIDMGLDNLAVTSSGQVKVIDAEHIVMVDRKKIEKGKTGWLVLC